MSDQLKFRIWEWAEWGSKLLITAIAALLWQTYNDVQKVKMQQDSNERRIAVIESKLENSMTRQEAMEMMKRVEQQLQIIVLQGQLEKRK
jgi:hypothetical protein